MRRLSMAVLATLGLSLGALAAEPEKAMPSDEAKPHMSKLHMGKGAAPTAETPPPAARMDKGQAPTTETPPPAAHMGKGAAPR